MSALVLWLMPVVCIYNHVVTVLGKITAYQWNSFQCMYILK